MQRKWSLRLEGGHFFRKRIPSGQAISIQSVITRWSAVWSALSIGSIITADGACCSDTSATRNGLGQSQDPRLPLSGDRWYGKTKSAKWMTEDDAIEAG